MDTIVLTLEEAEQSLARLVQRMRDDHLAVVVKEAEGPVAYLTLAWRLKDCGGGGTVAMYQIPVRNSNSLMSVNAMGSTNRLDAPS